MSKCVFMQDMLKAGVNLLHFWDKNQTTPWQGVHFFTNTVLQKS